ELLPEVDAEDRIVVFPLLVARVNSFNLHCSIVPRGRDRHAPDVQIAVLSARAESLWFSSITLPEGSTTTTWYPKPCRRGSCLRSSARRRRDDAQVASWFEAYAGNRCG